MGALTKIALEMHEDNVIYEKKRTLHALLKSGLLVNYSVISAERLLAIDTLTIRTAREEN